MEKHGRMLKDSSMIGSPRKSFWKAGWRVRGKERVVERWLEGSGAGGQKECLEGAREVKWREGDCEARTTTIELTG